MQRLFYFNGGFSGTWRVTDHKQIVCDDLPECTHITVSTQPLTDQKLAWSLKGITSNTRYVNKAEKQQLQAKQEGLGRPEATHASIIPIRKNSDWWDLTQEERREIFEETGHHTQIGLKYLPQIARKLYHCRDLSENEPFDFITWFEYRPEHATLFQELLEALRSTPEWKYVDREVEFLMVKQQ